METKGKLKGLVSKLLSPLVLTTGLAFSLCPNFSYADHKNDQKNLRDWYIINQGINTMINSFRGLNEYQFQRWIMEQDSYYRDNSRNRENGRMVQEELDPNRIPQTFVANYWKDFNGNGFHEINENVGLNKSKFNSNQSLITGFHLPIKNIQGKSYEMKFFNPKGKLVNKKSGFFEKDRMVRSRSINIKDTLENHGEGTYSVAFYFNDGHWNTREFELVHANSRNNSETRMKEMIIVEPIDVFIYSPEEINEEPKFKFDEDTLVDKLNLHSYDGTFYYFDDGEQHLDFPHQYVSVDKERRKVSLGCPAGLEGVSVEFRPGNPIIDINDDQYLCIIAIGSNYKNPKNPDTVFNAKCHLSLYNKDKVSMTPHFISNGSYKIFDGNLYIGWKPGLKDVVYGKSEEDKKMVNLQISSFNSEERPIRKSDIFLFDNKYKTAAKLEKKRDLSEILWQPPRH